MAERIDLPPALFGDEKTNIRQIWAYLYRAAEILNRNIDEAGGGTKQTAAESGKSTQDEVRSGKFGTFVKETEVTVPSDENGNTQKITIEELLNSLQTRALNQTTTETNMNNITSPGTYWLNMDNRTNTPIATGTQLTQVFAGSGIIRQIVWTNANIYSRRKYNGEWNEWSAFRREEA